jgi:hypothetical protein
MSLFTYVKCKEKDTVPGDAIEGVADLFFARVTDPISGQNHLGYAVKAPVEDNILWRAEFMCDEQLKIFDKFDILTTTANLKYVRCKRGDQPPKGAIVGCFDKNGASYYVRGKMGDVPYLGKVSETEPLSNVLGDASLFHRSGTKPANKFEVLTSPSFVDEIVDIEFDIDSANVVSVPKVIATQTHSNDTSTKQRIEFKFSDTMTNQTSFSHNFGLKINVGTQFRCGLPTIAEGKVSLKMGASYNMTWGKKESTTKSYSGSIPVEVPAKTTVKCTATIMEATMDVPYKITWLSGNVFEGMWHGFTSWDLRTKFDEIKVKKKGLFGKGKTTTD